MHQGMLVTFPCSSLWLTAPGAHTFMPVCIMRAMHLCIVACIAICILDHAICISLYVGDISQLVFSPWCAHSLALCLPCVSALQKICTLHCDMLSPCTARYASLVMSGGHFLQSLWPTPLVHKKINKLTIITPCLVSTIHAHYVVSQIVLPTSHDS
jgi:hypothetical protein